MIFISHSSKDKEAALTLRQKLLDRGYDAAQLFLDSDAESGIPAGSKWEQVLYAHLKDCQALLVICSANLQNSKWCFAELVFAKAQGKAIFSVLIEDCAIDQVTAEYQSVFIHKEGEAAYKRLFEALDNQHLGPADDFGWPPKDGDHCPYPGLPAFDEKLAGVFFGREEEIESLLQELRKMRANGEPRFLMIVGGSGSGKSSILRAGVLSRLRHKVADSEWVVLPTLRYGERANEQQTVFDQLAVNVAGLFPRDLAHSPDWKVIRNKLAKDDASQAARDFLEILQDLTIARKCPDATVLIAIDQFEELLAPPAGPTADKFRRFLKELFDCPNGRALGIGTIRSDHLDTYERTAHSLASPFLHSWRLGPFPPERIEEIIRKPAKRAKVEITDELVEKLKADTPTTEALPLLAFTLEKLYRRYASDGKLELQEYKDLGGMEGSIQTCIERITPPGTLSPTQAAALRLSFVKHLAQVNDKGEVVRLTARWADLPEAAKPNLEKFINERLLTKSEHNDEHDHSNRWVTVEVAHEAIFRCWGDLKNWLRTSADILRWRRDVRRDQANDANWSGLRPVQLAVARDWPTARREELTSDELAWIRKGIARERLRLCAVAAIILFVTILAGAAWWQKGEADAQREKQKLLNIQLLTTNTDLSKSLANNNFVQGMGMLANDRGDKAIARFVQALRIDPSHSSASAALFSLLTRQWHPQVEWQIKHAEAVNEAMFTPDGTTFICRGDNIIYIHRIGDLKAPPLRLEHGKHIMSMHLAKKGDLLLTASTTWGEGFGSPPQRAEGTITLWDIATGRSLRSCVVQGAVFDAIFGPREERVLVSSAFGPTALTAELTLAPDKWPNMIEKDRHHIENVSSLIALNEGSNRLFWVGATNLFGPAVLYTWDIATWKLTDKREEKFNLAAFEFTPDGRTVVYACPDRPFSERGIGEEGFGYARGLTLEPTKELPWVVKHGDTITSLQIHPSGKTVVTASLDRTAKQWRIADGKVFSILRHPSAVTAAAFSPDGRLLVTGTEDGAVRIFDGLKGGALSETSWQQGRIASIRFDQTGDTFLTASSSGLIRCYRAGSTTFRQLVLETGKPRMRTARFLSSESPLAIIRSEDRIETWDCLKAMQVQEFLVGNKTASIANMSFDGKLVAIIDGKTAEARAVASGKTMVSLTHESEILHAEFSPIGSHLVTVSEHEAKVSSLTGDERVVQTLHNGNESYRTAHILPGDRWLIASTDKIHISKLSDTDQVEEFEHQEETSVNTVASDRSISSQKVRCKIVDVIVREDLNRLLVLYGSEGVSALQPNYKGRYLVQDAQLWTIKPLRPLSPRLGKNRSLNSAILNPTGDVVVTASNNRDNTGGVRFWSSKTGEPLHGVMKHPFPVFSVAFSVNGDSVAVFGKSTEVHQWSLKTGQRIGPVLPHDSAVSEVRFAGSSNALVVWTESGNIRLWDSETGMQIGDDIAAGQPVHSADVGLGGDLLMTVTGPGVANIHRIGAKQLVKKDLESLLAFAEADCGWRISAEGFEIRNEEVSLSSTNKTVNENTDADWREFYEWFRKPIEERSFFPGTNISAHAVFETLLKRGPGFISYIVLQYEPTNAGALMKLAESATSADREELITLARLCGATTIDDLHALASLWANQSAKLALNDPSMEQRRQSVLKAASLKTQTGER